MTKRKMRRALGLLAVGSLSLSGCTDWAGYDLDRIWGYIPALSVLRGSISYEPYELPRLPAEGTVPVASPMGEVEAPFTQTQLDSVGRVLTNPFPATAEVVERGRVVYERQCAVCHGSDGRGQGPVVGGGRFPFASNLQDAATVGRSDGYIYGVIRAGRGLMPAYGERISPADRWAVVHYVRRLQQAGPAAQTPGT